MSVPKRRSFLTTMIACQAVALIGVALILSVGCSRAETSARAVEVDSLEAAKRAYFQFDKESAAAILARIRQNEAAAPADRVAAGRRLSRITALFDQDIARARTLLAEAAALETDQVPLLLGLAQLERDAGDYRAARDAADRAAVQAETAPERYDAATEFAWAAATEAVDMVFDDQLSRLELDLLVDALARIEPVLDERRGLLAPSLIQLELALVLGDGPRALDAWTSYFHIPPGTSPTGVLAAPARDLERLLPNWRGQPLDDAVRMEVALALAGSRMYRAAALVAKLDPDGTTESEPQAQEMLAYYQFLLAVGDRTTAFYRGAAAGNGEQAAFLSNLEREARSLWPRLSWPNGPPEFSTERFQSEIEQRFGAEVHLKTANGHFGLHMGHRVVDEEYRVEQYGKEAALRFIALDFMVSNGYSSWFWDGQAQVGGWADNPTITQVRSAYAGGGIRAWEELSDAKKRREVEEKIAELAVKDVELARDDPYAYLPGLAARILARSGQRLLDRLEDGGLEGAELRLGFIAEVERLSVESSIVAHEGRHAIEERHPLNFSRRGSQKEYLAKLSEVAFSSSPFRAITDGILAPNVGDGTSHGDANRRLLKGLVKWMEKNRTSIERLDPELPLLPQLDLLTEDQLKRAIRSLDPRAS